SQSETGAAPTVFPAQPGSIDVRYSGYLERQRQQIAVVREQHGRPLEPTIPYHSITTLSKEAREHLSHVQPLTLGQASRIPGVGPADVNAFLLWLELQRRRQDQSSRVLACNWSELV
ncbi:MAG: hypothetical protein F4094_06570, partial [Synechococcus sp. SB0672_bin_6]|nr:hypothetical protein [Synechococcus sp. SB0672_bin_6]